MCTLVLVLVFCIAINKFARTLFFFYKHKTEYELTVFDEEWHFMRPNLKNCARTLDVTDPIAETGVKEPGIVDAKLPHGRIKGNHFGGKLWRHADPLFRPQDIKITRVKNDRLVLGFANRVPKFFRWIV